MSVTELYRFYNDHLKRFGIDESIDSYGRLSEAQRLDAASKGVGRELLSIWIDGRNRTFRC